MTTPELRPIDSALIAERYQTWSKLPSGDLHEMHARDAAWNLYCDARDGNPDGTAADKIRSHAGQNLRIVPNPVYTESE